MQRLIVSIVVVLLVATVPAIADKKYKRFPLPAYDGGNSFMRARDGAIDPSPMPAEDLADQANSAMAEDHDFTPSPVPPYSSPETNERAAPWIRKPLTGHVGINAHASPVDPRDYLPASPPARLKPSKPQGSNVNLRYGKPALSGRAAHETLGGSADQQALRASAAQQAPDRTRLPLSAGQPAAALNLNRLAGRDVILFVDKSESMRTKDCPGIDLGNASFAGGFINGLIVSRWEWCRNHIEGFATQTAPVLRDRISLVLFSGKWTRLDHVDARVVPSIFNSIRPDGWTSLAPPMTAALYNYFQLKAERHARPLSIAVITDGRPHDPDSLIETIIAATQHMTDPREIRITFVHIGNDMKGLYRLQQMADLRMCGAKYDIVDFVPFNSVQRLGLTNVLINALSR